MLNLVCLLVLSLLLNAVSFGSDRSEKPQEVGVLVMAHGGDPEWNRAVTEAVEPAGQLCPVEIAFGMAQRRSLELAVKRLEQRGVRRIAVVRIFVSPESFLHQTQYLLRLRPDPPAFFLHHDPRTDHSENRQPSHHVSTRPDGQAPVRVEGAGEPIKGVPGLNRYQAVRVETLREDWEDKRAVAEARIRGFVENQGRLGRVLVVPFRVFGFGPYSGVLEGLDHVATRQGLLPHPNVTEWIKEQASDCFSRAGWSDPIAAAARVSGSTSRSSDSLAGIARP